MGAHVREMAWLAASERQSASGNRAFSGRVALALTARLHDCF